MFRVRLAALGQNPPLEDTDNLLCGVVAVTLSEGSDVIADGPLNGAIRREAPALRETGPSAQSRTKVQNDLDSTHELLRDSFKG
jgi:hypothetical protein